jgi:tetratricopeptide (TPR) repeat protein
VDRTLAFNCVAAIALFVLVCSTATATPQAGAACTGDSCGQVADRPLASAAEIYERKQEFVAAVRQLAISLAGRFGNEGLRLQSDIDSLESALRRWDDAIAAFEKTLAQHGDDADAYTAAGAVYLDRYRTDDALRSFEAAAKLDAGRADVQKFIAMTFTFSRLPSSVFPMRNRDIARTYRDATVARLSVTRKLPYHRRK